MTYYNYYKEQRDLEDEMFGCLTSVTAQSKSIQRRDIWEEKMLAAKQILSLFKIYREN